MSNQRGLDVKTLPQIHGCVIGENQQYYQLDGQRVFDRPLQLSERLHKSASIAQFACGSSKDSKEVESSMSTPCAMARAYMAQIACGSSKGVERAMSAPCAMAKTVWP
jgi:hypothetical protein